MANSRRQFLDGKFILREPERRAIGGICREDSLRPKTAQSHAARGAVASNILEIGFQCWVIPALLHCSLASQTSKLTIIDLLDRTYAPRHCFDYLSSVFPGRPHAAGGRSRKIPAQANQGDFRSWFITTVAKDLTIKADLGRDQRLIGFSD